MMKLRRWSSLNKAEKLGRKSAFMVSLVYAILIFIVVTIMFVCIASIPNIGFILAFETFMKPFPLIPILIFQFGIPILCYFLIRNEAINSAYDIVAKNFSKTFVEQHLPRGEYCEVRIFKTRDYQEFITGLSDVSKSYAVLGTEDELITLYIKFNGNDIYRKLGIITKEEFSSFCELL